VPSGTKIPVECNAWVAYVPRDGNCNDGNYQPIACGQKHILEIKYSEKICVKAKDSYDNNASVVFIVPDSEVTIASPSADTYKDSWPVDVNGSITNHMSGDWMGIVFECNGPNGDYFLQPTGTWDENRAEVSVPVDMNGNWYLAVPNVPKTLGTCTVTATLHGGRPDPKATKTFEFTTRKPELTLEIDNNDVITNGCEYIPVLGSQISLPRGFPTDDLDEKFISPECNEFDVPKDFAVYMESNTWGAAVKMMARCNDGNWIVKEIPPTYLWNEQELEDNGYVRLTDMNDIFPGIYEECMKEGNVTLYIGFVDIFGRKIVAEDRIEYHPNAWKIYYDLKKGWNLIGMPFHPYRQEIGKHVDSNVTSVWAYDGQWNVFRNGEPELSNLQVFESGKGYMIEANGDSKIAIWGYYVPETNTNPPMPSTIFVTRKGWNLVAFDVRPDSRVGAITATDVLNSRELFTTEDAENPWDFQGAYARVPFTLDMFPVFGTKGYWLYTENDGVPVHSVYNTESLWRLKP